VFAEATAFSLFSTRSSISRIAAPTLVIAGARAITNGPGKDWGISVYTPVIVKYRDAKTDTRIQLEDLLR
jgi:2,3,4,5-tetrahydropyridine-2-carboxylate N-succinyltransferase